MHDENVYICTLIICSALFVASLCLMTFLNNNEHCTVSGQLLSFLI